jgi:hypothetical protein
MPFEFIQVPARGGSSGKEELNRLLRSWRIVSVRKEFAAAGEDSFWAFCVAFLEGAVVAAAGRTATEGTNVPSGMILRQAPGRDPTEPAPRPFIQPMPNL